MAIYQAAVAFDHAGRHVEVEDDHVLYQLFPSRFVSAAGASAPSVPRVLEAVGG